MNEIIVYSQVALAGIFILLLLMWKKYGVRTLLHPFSIFLVTWIPTFIVIPIYASINAEVYLFDQKAVLELIGFFLFTLFAIFISIQLIPIAIKGKKININIQSPSKILFWLSFFLLAFNLTYNIITFGTDITANREIVTSASSQVRITGSSSFLYSLRAILNSLLVPLLIISGKEILYKLMFGKQYHLPLFAIISPSIILMNTIMGGGRAAIIGAIITMILGSMLFYNYQVPLKKIAVRGGLIIIIAFSFFSAYTTYIAEMRAQNIGNEVTYIFKDSKLAFLNGVMEYSFWHVFGYQLRMNDTFTHEPEGFSGNSLGFITNLTMPFSSQFGMQNNLGKLLEIKKEEKQKVYRAERITASVFFNLYDDLGFTGALIAILIFTFFTQSVFKWVVSRQIYHMISLAIFIFVYGLWRSSWFHHIIGGINLISVFIPYILYEILISFQSKSKKVIPDESTVVL